MPAEDRRCCEAIRSGVECRKGGSSFSWEEEVWPHPALGWLEEVVEGLEMLWTGGVPEELVKKLEAKKSGGMRLQERPRFPDRRSAPRDLWLGISRRVAGADARRSRWEGA